MINSQVCIQIGIPKSVAKACKCTANIMLCHQIVIIRKLKISNYLEIYYNDKQNKRHVSWLNLILRINKGSICFESVSIWELK